MLSTLATDTEQGFQNLISGTDPYAAALDTTASSATTFPDLLSALEADAADPAATFTEFVNATLECGLDTVFHFAANADIINSLVTSMPSWETSIFADTLSNGDLLDALGLPVAGTVAIGTLAAGFEVSILSDAFSQVAADFSGLF